VVEVIGYRWADYDTPLWINRNRSAGRWHDLGDEPTQYWALHPLGPWAEHVRAQRIRDLIDLEQARSRTWAASFSFEKEEDVAYISFDSAHHWSIDPAALVDDDQTACQALGRALRVSYRAIIVPSAALPGTENLVVFGPRALSAYGVAPNDLEIDVPSAVTADAGRPPSAVLDFVRHFGNVHPGLVAWQSIGTLLPPPSVSYT
jgi:RES domain-containing protein